jgi:hypothetical protein
MNNKELAEKISNKIRIILVSLHQIIRLFKLCTVSCVGNVAYLQ